MGGAGGIGNPENTDTFCTASAGAGGAGGAGGSGGGGGGGCGGVSFGVFVYGGTGTDAWKTGNTFIGEGSPGDGGSVEPALVIQELQAWQAAAAQRISRW